MRSLRRCGAAAFILALAAGVSAGAAAECQADVKIDFRRKDPGRTQTKYIFKIDVAVKEQCGVVEFNVLLDTRDPGAETVTVKKDRKFKVRSGDISHGYTYSAPTATEVTNWRVDDVRCTPCE